MSAFNPPVANIDLDWLFRADWKGGLRVTTAWETDVHINQSDDESRRGLVSRPYRTLEFSLEAIADSGYDAAAVSELAKQLASGRLSVPLYPDFATLTAPIPAGAGAPFVAQVRSAQNRRFFAGQRALVVDALASTIESSSRTRYRYEAVGVLSVGAASITIEQPTTAFPAGARIYPMVRGEVGLSADWAAYTREKASSSVEVKEVGDADAIPALVAPGSSPAGETLFAGLPVLAQMYDWSENVPSAYARQGTLPVVGLDVAPDLYGMYPRAQHELAFKCLSRSDAFRALRFFDSRGGRLYPFWLPSPTADARVSRIVTSTQIECPDGYPPRSTWTQRVGRHLAFVWANGTVTITRVASVSGPAGGVNTVNLVHALPSSSPLRRCSWCPLVRFDEDSTTEEWMTDEAAVIRATVLELRVCGSDSECQPSYPYVYDPRTGEQPDPPWVPSPDCFTASGVTVPMMVLPCESCDSRRPVTPARDLALPRMMEIQIDGSKLSGGSAEMRAAVGGRWGLTYDPDYVFSQTVSRHWHHLKITSAVYTGAAWSHDPPTVTRRLWRATRSYTDGTGQPRIVEVRLVAEWETNPSQRKGLYGAHFLLYVFSDEQNSGYVDGTATGSPPVAFYRDDPAVWDSSGAKRSHPQMALIGGSATSFESPCKYPFQGTSPPENDFCPLALYGAPWADDDHDDTQQAVDNVVFGTDSDTYNMHGMSLGGSCSGSVVFPYIIVENNAGAALSAGENSGWDEERGGLVYSPASACSINLCYPSQPSFDCCYSTGYPTGTVDCWRPSPTAVNQCCISTNAQIQLTIVQKCVCDTICYAGDCATFCLESTGSSSTCAVYSRTIMISIDSCSYAETQASGVNRELRWVYREADPAYTPHDFADDFGNGSIDSKWTQKVSTWTEAEGVVESGTGAASGALAAWLLFNDFAAYRDGSVAAVYFEAGKDWCLLARTNNPGPVAAVDGYALVIRSDGGAHIYALEDDAWESLKSIPAPSPPITAGGKYRLSFSGGLLRGQRQESSGVWVTIKDAEGEQLSAEDCRFSSGYVGLGVPRLGGAAPAVDSVPFDDASIEDDSPTLLEIFVRLGQLGWEFGVPERSMPGWNQGCTGNTCVYCGCAHGSSTCSGCNTTKYLVPIAIYDAQGTEPSSCGAVAVPNGSGVPCGYDYGEPGEECVPTGDFIALTGVVVGNTCPGTSDSKCTGFDWWWICRAVEP